MPKEISHAASRRPERGKKWGRPPRRGGPLFLTRTAIGSPGGLPHRVFAAILTFLLALPACLFSAEVKLERTKEKVELSGGQGNKAWHMTYGTMGDFSAIVVSVSPTHAYFAHGCQLRLLDTENGKVFGRWHFPGEQIMALKPAGGDLIDVTSNDWAGPTFPAMDTYRFDPANPRIPSPYLDNLYSERLPEREAAYVAGTELWKIPTFPGSDAQARQALAALEDMVWRDPLSPWFVLAKARLLEMMNDPKARQTYRSVLDIPASDFSEWLRVACFLARTGDRSLFDAAYQRAFADYIQSDHDPRLFAYVLTRLVLFPPAAEIRASEDLRRDYLEAAYRLSPYGEGAAIAWELHAREFDKSGPPELARLWHARADDARAQGEIGFTEFGRSFDQWMLVFLAGLVAALLYFVLVNRSYRAQHLMDTAAGRRRWSFMGCANIRYWAGRQRFALLAVALLCWLASGLASGYLISYLRVAASPLSPWAGSFASPVPPQHFRRQPPSPARDLLVAQALLQGGDSAGAEQLYRRLPEYPQSWNNLGVLLKNAGKDAEARTAFEHALELDPQLHEAALNLGRPPADLWTEQHARFAPGKPMIAPVPMSVVRDTYRGRLGRFLAKALLGPLRCDEVFWMLEGGDVGWSRWMRRLVYPLAVATMLLLLGSVFLVFVPPAQVTEGADPAQHILEMALPGSSMRWSAPGGLALACWCLLLIQLLLYFSFGTPYLFCKAFGTLSVQRAFLIDASERQVLAFLNPPWWLLYGGPVILFAVNLLLLRPKSAGKAAAAAWPVLFL